MFSKRYRSNKDSVKIMFWWFFHVLFRDCSCFLVCFVTTGWFPKRWANLQTRAKLGSPQNTPNTVFKRPSKLIISVMFYVFYEFNQTFWCCIVGVFLIETSIISFFRNCLQRVFVLQDFFIFRKIVIFVMDCIRWFKLFCIFVFEKTHSGVRIDAKIVFTFLFFLWMPLKNQRSMMKKTEKIGVFTFFIIFSSLGNCFRDISF